MQVSWSYKQNIIWFTQWLYKTVNVLQFSCLLMKCLVTHCSLQKHFALTTGVIRHWGWQLHSYILSLVPSVHCQRRFMLQNVWVWKLSYIFIHSILKVIWFFLLDCFFWICRSRWEGDTMELLLGLKSFVTSLEKRSLRLSFASFFIFINFSTGDD